MAMRTMGAVLLLGAVSWAQADVLWDNGDVRSGWAGFAVSPPAYPDIRVGDDIHVHGEEGWTIHSFRYGLFVPTAWYDGGTTEIYIIPDVDGHPGTYEGPTVVAAHTKELITFFGGGDLMEYTVADVSVELAPGEYWIGLRHPDAYGSLTGYWYNSDGGRDGAGTPTGFWSEDAGQTWTQLLDERWQFSMVIEGVPEPTTAAALLLLGAIFGRGRSRA